MIEASLTAPSGPPSGPPAVPPPPDETIESLASQTGLPPALTTVLWLRGLRDADAIQAFLHPEPAQLHDPYTMLGMRAAVGRLRAALLRAEPILIYGDYDVDG